MRKHDDHGFALPITISAPSSSDSSTTIPLSNSSTGVDSLVAKSSHTHDARKGFSLAEVVIVLLVGSVLASITIPQVSDLRVRLSRRGAVDEFVAAHNLARTIAIRSGRTSELRIEPESGTFWVQVDSSLAGTGAMDTIGTVVRLSDLRVSLNSSGLVLCFDGRGIASSFGDCDATQNAVITFTSGAKADTLRRTALGVIPR